MKKYKNQIIHNKTNSRNDIIFSKECLENCVKNLNQKNVPITQGNHRQFVVGYMNNIRYEEENLIADVQLFKCFPKLNMIEKSISCLYLVIKKSGDNPTLIEECILLDGKLIDENSL